MRGESFTNVHPVILLWSDILPHHPSYFLSITNSKEPFLREFDNTVKVFHEISAKPGVLVVLLLTEVRIAFDSTLGQQNWGI